MSLPTKEEYYKQEMDRKYANSQWSEPKYICPTCGGNMRKNLTISLVTFPQQFTYRCDNCGNEENIPF